MPRLSGVISRRPRRRHRGFTILELLCTSAIIGILMALLLPAVSASREAARSLQCRNNLKQFGLALHSYHDTHQCLPAGLQWQSYGKIAYGWAVPLLPLVDQGPVYSLVDRNLSVGDPVNLEARESTFSFALCPSDIADPRFSLFAEDDDQQTDAVPLLELPTTNYVGIFGTFEPDETNPPPLGDGGFIAARPVRFPEFLRGLSNTMIVGERTMARVPSTWLGADFRGEDAACRMLGNAELGPNHPESDECELDSRHPGCVNVLWGDGHVKPIGNGIDSITYQNLARRSTFPVAVPAH